MKRSEYLVGLCLSLASGALGCDGNPNRFITLHETPVYQSAKDCHASQRIRRLKELPPSPVGKLPAGVVVDVQGRDYSKDYLCVRVETKSVEGYVLVGVTTKWVYKGRLELRDSVTR
jgi:hypothetical protein